MAVVGMTGVGKSTAARVLAERWGWEHIDVDAVVSATTGTAIAELWRDQGEAAFRAHERQAVAEALVGASRRVVALGGGAVLDPGTRAVLRRAARVVWLRADPATIVERLSADDPGGAGRPVLDGDPARTVPELADRRRRWYEEVADVVVDVDDKTPEQVATAIEAALATLGHREL